MTEPITLALPKGRLTERATELLARTGREITFGDRQLVGRDGRGDLRTILVKNADLPTYVHHGIATLGICGTDVITESGHDLLPLLRLPFGSTRICLAGLRSETDDHRASTSLRIATKFPRFTTDFFHRRGIPVSLIHLNGSVELAPVLGLAPWIVDLVETGRTLEAHDLEVREELGRTEVYLVANAAMYRYDYVRVDALVAEIRAVLEDGV